MRDWLMIHCQHFRPCIALTISLSTLTQSNLSIDEANEFIQVCLSLKRYDGNDNIYYDDDDDDVSWAALELYDETSYVVLCIEMIKSISIVQ